MINKFESIQKNIIIHNKIAKEYEKKHGEIYNEVEQERLRLSLKMAISNIETEGKEKTVMDFGCGAGNLTNKLTEFGCDVLACDVSQGFLDLINSRIYSQNVKTQKLNGINLSEVPNESVDMVATYSVLHHVPDYLEIIHEFSRVLKPGGVIYIDHEPSEEYWLNINIYSIFKNEMSKFIKINWQKYFVPTNYYDWFIRKTINPRYHREGDIHVFEDDHVDWRKIKSILIGFGFDVVFDESYLLYRRGYDIKTYEKYKPLTTDMRVMIFKKIK